ncbi:MAG: UbiA family prenyltransferase [Acidobacteriota bacterium]|nr:MAG: UbiA family prenyltransferase [Acidobacteriota bacterium]
MLIRSIASKTMIVLEMIKIEHTVFALPFAFMGAFLAARGIPGISESFWILAAMVGARSAAMAFNRLVDREFDGANPRTEGRALPQQLVTPFFVKIFIILSSALLLFSAWMLNPLAFALSPVALIIVLGYSYTKRFTAYAHVVLGLALGIAPIGGWVAVRGSLELEPLLLCGAVLFWVGGFDIIYACQDEAFDRSSSLFSIPSRYGIRGALIVSRLFHISMVLILLGAFYYYGLGWMSYIGLLCVAAGLIYEHSLLSPGDLSRINAAFFTVNGIISILLFVFVGIDLCLFV